MCHPEQPVSEPHDTIPSPPPVDWSAEFAEEYEVTIPGLPPLSEEAWTETLVDLEGPPNTSGRLDPH